MNVNSIVHEFRWDKGNIDGYCQQTGMLLNNIAHDFSCMQCNTSCNNKDCHLDIDIYYNEIVHCLMEAARCNIPKIPSSALKHYWSAALDDLKSDSIFAFSVWKSAGRPRSGSVYELKKNAKYRYKLAIRDAANQFEDKFNDELLDSYMNKDFKNFWHCWKKKTCNKSPRVSSVDGHTGDVNIANRFADHFSTLCDNNDCPPIFKGDGHNSYETKKWLFTVDDVVNVICNSLKKGKAAGADNITAEHVIYADPIIAYHLCNLFNLIIQHGYVPAQFGSGIIIPLIKDRLGDATKLDNYRAITLSCVVSKIFEFCVSCKYGNFLTSNDLQFGF